MLYLGNEANPYVVLIKTTNSKVVECEINDSTKIIYSGAFDSCYELITIAFSKNLTCIGKRAFYYCKKLNNVYLPYSISSIGEMAFYNCSSLKNAYYPGTKDEWQSIIS